MKKATASFSKIRERMPPTAFDAALARDPASPPALNNLGITYFSRGELPQAAQYLQKAVGQDPNNATTRYNLEILLMQLQDPSAAVHEFRESGFIDPKAVSASIAGSLSISANGRLCLCRTARPVTLKLDPSLVPAHMLLGIALYNQGKEAEALTSFRQALSLEPGNRARLIAP